MNRTLFAWIFALAALASALGCRRHPKPTAEGWHVVRVPHIIVTNLEDIADELGFFEEMRVKVDWKGELPTGQSYHAALASGEFDVVSWAHSDGIIKARLAGAKVRVIGGADATADYPHMAWYVLEDSPIRSPTDLVGKKMAGQSGRADHISVDGCAGMALAEFMRNANLDVFQANIEGVSLPAAQMMQALKMKLVDVGTFHPPFKGRVAATPGYRKLFDDYVAMSPSSGKGATRVTSAREDWLRTDPEGARRFVAAMALAADWVNAHEAEAKKIWAKRLSIRPEDQPYMDMFRWLEHQLVREKEDVQLWIDLMVRYGQLKPGQVNAREIYTNEYNPYADKLLSGELSAADLLRQAEAIAVRHYPSYLARP